MGCTPARALAPLVGELFAAVPVALAELDDLYLCAEIEKRYEIKFLEIGTDNDHVHFLVQSVPMYSPKKVVQIIKSLAAREIFRACPQVKKYLWGGEFWTDGYFITTVGAHGNENMIKNYVEQQGKLAGSGQLDLF